MLPYDRDDPPVEPPPRCTNRLMWRVARQLFGDHQAGPDGFCLTCRPHQFHPCTARRLADIDLETAYRYAGR